jgi:histidinol-phosphate/aromatic aminotransferase/cobyric acid decarboxylase-like protein
VLDELALLRVTVAAGARVLCFGCADPYADALAELGYRVTRAASEPDLFSSDALAGNGAMDAAVFLRPRNADDAGVLRALRAVRGALADDGLLMVACGRGRTVTAVAGLVCAAGFELVPSPAPGWILARAAPCAPSGLAVCVHHDAPAAELNLRWSPDEVDFLEPAPERIWGPLLAENVAGAACSYALNDPWGSERAAPVLASFFGVPIAPGSVVFGAGATGLLRQLASLVRAGRLLTTPYVHRDFPLWAIAEGAQIGWISDERDDEKICSAVAAAGPHVLYFDRPSSTGAVVSLDCLARMCAQAREHCGLVLVDEAYLAYFAGAGSAVSLVPATDNLIVIRSMSKAYCAGGLRVGFAVAGTIAARSLRRLVAPLQVSELAFRMGLSLLAAGDIFVRLRARIAEAKLEMTDVLARAGFSVVAGDRELPWVVLDDPSGRAQAEFAARGIAGKRLVPFSSTCRGGLLRLCVPLSPERVAHFRRAMGIAS